MSIVIHERTRSGNTEERSCDEFIDAVPHAQEQSSSGRVYLVGAGPGDPELITLKALRCLRVADVVVYDRLISPCLLDEARSEAERVFVGKEPGCHSMKQEEINALLVTYARQGHTVVRLKGGDPFVFGRGGEEALALAEAGIPFEIVPGVSSAIAVPAYAGIPVTHRDYAHSFMVVTGSGSHDLDSPEWLAAATLVKAGGTVVVLMGLSRLAAIAGKFLANDCAATTPVAVISRGTYLNQDCRVGTLADIKDDVERLRAPAIIVIGEVVSLRNEINWIELADKFQ